MWVPLGMKNYVLKKRIVHDGCNLYISDFIHIWSSVQKNEELLSVFKETNPFIEAPDEKLIEKIIALFDEIKIADKKLENNENQLILHVTSDLSGIKFHFKLNFDKQDADLLFKEITLPLILLSTRLQMRHNKLVEIIYKKDAEINEYKKENVFIKRSHLITKNFDINELKAEEQNEDFNSLLETVSTNPTSILDMIDMKMLQIVEHSRLVNKVKDENRLQKNIKCEKIDVDSKKNSSFINHSQQHKKSYVKCGKSRNKIEVQINSAIKRNHNILKF